MAPLNDGRKIQMDCQFVEDPVIKKHKKPVFTGEPLGIQTGENPAGQASRPQPLKGFSLLVYSLVTLGRWPKPLTALSVSLIGLTHLAPTS